MNEHHKHFELYKSYKRIEETEMEIEMIEYSCIICLA